MKLLALFLKVGHRFFQRFNNFQALWLFAQIQRQTHELGLSQIMINVRRVTAATWQNFPRIKLDVKFHHVHRLEGEGKSAHFDIKNLLRRSKQRMIGVISPMFIPTGDNSTFQLFDANFNRFFAAIWFFPVTGHNSPKQKTRPKWTGSKFKLRLIRPASICGDLCGDGC